MRIRSSSSLDVHMPRVTIYVPDELKARMDRLEDRVNWSAAAQRAFEQALEAERWRNMTDELDRAVARLKQSKQDFDDKEKTRGAKMGREWALNRASYEELERLDGIEWENADDLSCQMVGEYEHRTKSGFWDDEQVSDLFATSFVEAALSVFHEVQKRL